MTTSSPRPPRGLGREGKVLYKAIAGQFELQVWEESQLVALCNMADRLHLLALHLRDAEPTIVNGKGDEVAHPVGVEYRLLLAAYQRGLVSLGIRSGVVDEGDAMPRGSYRGAYSKGSTPLRAVK